MANYRDFEMLNNAIQNLGEGALKRRQLDEQSRREMERMAMEKDFRQMQMTQADNALASQEKRADASLGAQKQHYSNMQGAYADRTKQMASDLAAKAKKANQDAKRNSAMLVMDLSKSNMDNASKTATFLSSIDEEDLKNPVIAAMVKKVKSGDFWNVSKQKMEAGTPALKDVFATRERLDALKDRPEADPEVLAAQSDFDLAMKKFQAEASGKQEQDQVTTERYSYATDDSGKPTKIQSKTTEKYTPKPDAYKSKAAQEALKPNEVQQILKPSAPEGKPASFASESEARASGSKPGDIVYIQGVGKVRLK